MKKRIFSLVLVLSVTASLITAMPVSASDNIKIGDYLQMGQYYGKPILWRCVDIDENGPLMLSDRILCLKAFDAKGTNKTGSHHRGYNLGIERKDYGSNYWADSNIRCWLNSKADAGNVSWACGNSPNNSHVWKGYNEYDQEAGFLTNFTNSELACIKTVTQDSLLDREEYSDMSPYGSTYHEVNESISSVVQNAKTTAYREQVTDSMFLLDVNQIYKVYQNDSLLGGNKYYIGIPTAEAVANSEYKSQSLKATERWWSWLRSPYALYFSYYVRYIHSGGGINFYDAYTGHGGIRPAFYLNLSSAQLTGGAGTVDSPYTISENYNTTSDDYIIDEVRKYTSSGEMAQFNAIMNSKTSIEEKFRRLNELFNNYGITDIKEGIKYLSDTTSYRSDYLYLTTDEIYCAYNWWDWLYSHPIQRELLIADGLIFNSEAFANLNPATYIGDLNLPGIKKNKTLLKNILEANNKSAKIVSNSSVYTQKTVNFLKNLIKLNNLTDDTAIKESISKMKDCKTAKQFDDAVENFADLVAQKIGSNIDRTVYLDGKNFSKALGKSATILKFADATADDIVAMINLNEQIETYESNSKFLSYIYQTPEVSWEMRQAAYQLLDDINNGYWKKVQSLLGNIFTLEKGLIFADKALMSEALEKYLGVSGSTTELFSGALATLKLATYISNIVIDTGDFVKQAAYTQGYAELATLYSLKLQDDKQAFLANETAENAWQFFEDYTILWNLRYQGEQQYLDMNKIKMYIFASVPTYNYKQKNEVASDTMAQLNQRQFTIAEGVEIPKSIQYVKKSVVNCPVDVYVYNSAGDLIATLKDGEVSDTTNEYGRFAVVYQSYSGEYAKVICQSTNEELTLKMVAVGNGLVDYQSSDINTTDISTIDKLTVETGNLLNVTNDVYEVDADADGTVDIIGDIVVKNSDEYVPVKSATLNKESLEMIEGDSTTVGIEILPLNATNTSVEWCSLDESVAKVKNGVITATGGGKTTIYAKICDSDIELELPVSVIALRELNFDKCEIKDDCVYAKITASTILEEQQSGQIIVALYDSGRLVQLFTGEICVDYNNPQTKDYTFDKYLWSSIENVKVKAFWLKGLNTLQPLCKAMSTTVIENSVE